MRHGDILVSKLLTERPTPPAIGAAGTYFKEPQELADIRPRSCFLRPARASPPYLDEAQTGVVSTPIMQDERGLPRPFEPGRTRGVSDHLPLVGRLVLPETSNEHRIG